MNRYYLEVANKDIYFNSEHVTEEFLIVEIQTFKFTGKYLSGSGRPWNVSFEDIIHDSQRISFVLATDGFQIKYGMMTHPKFDYPFLTFLDGRLHSVANPRIMVWAWDRATATLKAIDTIVDRKLAIASGVPKEKLRLK